MRRSRHLYPACNRGDHCSRLGAGRRAVRLCCIPDRGRLSCFAACRAAGTGLFYGLPMPVQPMKAVSAVILTDGLRPGEVAAVGMMLGVVLLVLGATGAIGRFARLIPQSVSTGLQLGLGLLMGVLGIRLILETPEDRLRLPCPSRPADARPILSGSTNHARSGCGRGVAQQQRGLAARDFPGMERAAARHSEMAGSIAQF